jgi:hypothetical protein
MSLLPNKEELADIRRALAEAGVTNPNADAIAVAAFQALEYTPERIDAWVTVQKTARPELWVAAKTDNAVDALHVAALGSLQAQGELVRKVGEAEAQKIMVAQGGKLGAVKPVNNGGDADSPSTNPWRLDPTPASQQLIIDFIRRRGSALSASYAKSAGKDLNGRPLKVA